MPRRLTSTNEGLEVMNIKAYAAFTAAVSRLAFEAPQAEVTTGRIQVLQTFAPFAVPYGKKSEAIEQIGTTIKKAAEVIGKKPSPCQSTALNALKKLGNVVANITPKSNPEVSDSETDPKTNGAGAAIDRASTHLDRRTPFAR